MTDQNQTEPPPGGRADQPLWLIFAQVVPGIAGIVIGTIALFAALNEADAVRKQQEASVWPHIQIDRSNFTVDEDRATTITVRNRGIGPAKIRYADVTLDGDPVEWWTDLFRRLEPEVEKIYPKTDSYIGQTVLSPQQDAEILVLDTQIFDEYVLSEEQGIATRQELAAIIDRLRIAMDDGRVNIELCYCSVFDECWRVSNVTRDPWRVDTCIANVPNSRF
ncbi:MAG: hypothetical protein AAF583_14360 [Pseudomonadota bacterium]